MYRHDELDALRARLAPKLLAIEGVAAVGNSSDALNVYLSADSDAVRGRVKELVHGYANEAPIHFVVSGDFWVDVRSCPRLVV
jgi:hypothetical protein